MAGIWVVRYFIKPRLTGAGCEPSPRTGLQIGLWYTGASLVGSYVAAFIIHFTILPGFMGSARSIVVSGMFTLIFAGLFTGIHYAIAFHRQSVDRARQVEQIRAELAEAELRALRAQINPHFLFNTLNSIAALIAEDPVAAEDTTTRLAEVFRYALRASEREHARFADELAFLRSYLEIERIRFGERLHIEQAIEPGLEHLLVPSLLLQPVVENAVRHGVSARADGGTLRLSARRDGDRLEIEIADDGPGMNGAEPPAGGGFGLRSVRERLRALGLVEAVNIDSTPGRGTRVRITLPVRTSAV
jgi:two-component system LytT family sensor kinase